MSWEMFGYPEQGLLALATYANDTTYQMFFPLMLSAIWIIIFTWSSYRINAKAGMLSASFITGTLSILLRAAGLCPDSVVIILVLLTGIGALMAKD